ncbi:MAG: VacJ family lipoprotein [Fusobacteriaceae bacterium]|jgi:phospholipid-binding lipoprotein MlaA|nr:VacJ family lipoprotein [Fusobacteriaceae bacterium]
MKTNKLFILYFIFSLFTIKIVGKPETTFNKKSKILYVYDPFEGFNRRVYYFNYGLDKYILFPIINAYNFITPNFVQKGVHNFFDNNRMIKVAANSLLQFKIKKAMRAVGRFSINASAGFGGLIDTSSALGMPIPYEDFGLTLAHYGVGTGPYLVLPIFGPSNLRDAIGRGVDAISLAYLDPYLAAELYREQSKPLTALDGLDTRKRTSFRYYSTGSPFEYEYLRLLYAKYREIQVKANKTNTAK